MRHDVDNAEIIFDGKDDADPYQDEWASTSTELKEKPSMFALVARNFATICTIYEGIWSSEAPLVF